MSGANFARHIGFVEIFHVSAKDGSELGTETVPVIFGRMIVPGYTTYLEYEVHSGDTLWGIAQAHYGNGNLYHRLISANPSITNPNLIAVGDVIRIPRA